MGRSGKIREIFWRSWIRMQLWSDLRSWSNFHDCKFPEPYSRSDSGLPRKNIIYKYCVKCLSTTTCSRRTTLYNIEQFSKNLESSSQDFTFQRQQGKKWKGNHWLRRFYHLTSKSRSGILDHAGEIYPQVGVDCLKVRFTEWNLGKCDFSWNVKAVRLTSRTYDCMRTADPQITMPRIREVEAAPVVDRTWKISRCPFARCDDCVRLEVHQYTVDLPKKYRRAVLRGSGYVRATEAYEAALGLEDLVSMSLQNHNFQDLDIKWNHAL